jgi:ribosomal protein S27AE
MEKYGVDETLPVSGEELEKKAMQGCPKCGGRVERHGATLSCVKCGTEPFEQEKK